MPKFSSLSAKKLHEKNMIFDPGYQSELEIFLSAERTTVEYDQFNKRWGIEHNTPGVAKGLERFRKDKKTVEVFEGGAVKITDSRPVIEFTRPDPTLNDLKKAKRIIDHLNAGLGISKRQAASAEYHFLAYCLFKEIRDVGYADWPDLYKRMLDGELKYFDNRTKLPSIETPSKLKSFYHKYYK